VAWRTLVGVPLAGLAPALLLLLVTAAGVDYGRAHLVLHGGGAARALARGLGTVLRRPAPLLHLLAHHAVWLAVTMIYLALTVGRDFPGAGGALVLLLLRQLTAVGRFVARTVASGGQIASLGG
jgi:hypothetical protein